VPEQVNNFFERCLLGDLFEGVSGNDEFASFTIDTAEVCFGCDDALKPGGIRHVVSL